MQVAHKVNDKSQRVGTLRGGRIPIFQNGKLSGDSGQYTSARAAEIFRRAMRHVYWNIDEVPRRSPRIPAALVVGPRGRVRKWIQPSLAAIAFQLWIDWIGGQQCQQGLFCLRIEVLLGQDRDRFMPSTTPGFGAWSERGRECGQCEEDKSRNGTHHRDSSRMHTPIPPLFCKKSPQ